MNRAALADAAVARLTESKAGCRAVEAILDLAEACDDLPESDRADVRSALNFALPIENEEAA